MSAFWLSLGLIFLAELGDKSQLLALTFATRYKARYVILGIFGATLLVHLASVAIGCLIGTAFESYQSGIAIAAGLLFLGFALWTLRGDKLSEAEAEKAITARGAAIFAVGVAFFLAELGDKTMLATITLAMKNQWIGVWIGSTVGMVAADALAILLGTLLGKHLPERVVKIGAAILFAIFGTLLILEGSGVLG